MRLIAAIALACWAGQSLAGNQQYEPLAASVQAALHNAISDQAAPEPEFPSIREKIDWLTDMSQRLRMRMPDREGRLDFLKTVYYEAKRAGLDPQMVLGLIQVESGFHKYATSGAGARGYMQVMPFWVKLIGQKDNNLFHLRINLRYGCTILRHYLDIENGDLYRALGRYNGSLGQPEYPNMVRAAWEKQWAWPPRATQSPAKRFEHDSEVSPRIMKLRGRDYKPQSPEIAIDECAQAGHRFCATKRDWRSPV